VLYYSCKFLHLNIFKYIQIFVRANEQKKWKTQNNIHFKKCTKTNIYRKIITSSEIRLSVENKSKSTSKAKGGALPWIILFIIFTIHKLKKLITNKVYYHFCRSSTFYNIIRSLSDIPLHLMNSEKCFHLAKLDSYGIFTLFHS